MTQVKRDKFASWRPKRIDRFEMQPTAEQAGQKLYTLKNVERRTYLRLTEKGRLLWDMLDGEHNVVAILAESRRLGFPLSVRKLFTFLDLLKGKEMIQAYGENANDQASSDLSLGSLGKALVYREWAIEVGPLIEWLYRHIAWLFYTSPAIIVLSVLSIAGPLCFIAVMLWNPRAVAAAPHGILHPAAIVLTSLIVVIVHEGAHAFTTLHFGREAPRSGLMLYYGNVCTFVDTNDIWMCGKDKRVLTSAAGPFSSWVLGSLASVLAFSVPYSTATPILFQVAAWCFLAALFPLNPIMEFDGYYMLIDWLEVPHLRRKSFRFIAHELLPRLHSHRPLDRRERAYLIYGLLALVFSVISVLMPFYLVLNHAIREWVGGSGILWATIPIILAMALSLMWELITRITRWFHSKLQT